jgi:hypothetical protein
VLREVKVRIRAPYAFLAGVCYLATAFGESDLCSKGIGGANLTGEIWLRRRKKGVARQYYDVQGYGYHFHVRSENVNNRSVVALPSASAMTHSFSPSFRE